LESFIEIERKIVTQIPRAKEEGEQIREGHQEMNVGKQPR
jgi:hypothetical protein